MRKSLFFIAWLISYQLATGQSYKELHFGSIVVDTHNDILTKLLEKNLLLDRDLTGKAHSDLYRFRKAGIDVQVFSIWCDGSFGKGKGFARANQEIDTLYAVAKRHPDLMMIVTNSADLNKAVQQKKLAAMIGVEGGHMIEDRLDYLDSLYRRGARYLTLTWNNSTDWASSAMDETAARKKAATDLTAPLPKMGLSDFGKQVVKRMNELGMMVDLSHAGEQTFWDAIHTTTKPVLISHSCAYALCPVFRNLKDDQIKAVGKNGGVIHLNFFSGFLDSTFNRKHREFTLRHKTEKDSLLQVNTDTFFAEHFLFDKYAAEVNAMRPPLSLLLDHLDHIIQLIGVDHVGLGSDFDGITSTAQQLDDITAMPIITQELLKRGYKSADVRKVLGGNFIRVLKANENP